VRLSSTKVGWRLSIVILSLKRFVLVSQLHINTTFATTMQPTISIAYNISSRDGDDDDDDKLQLAYFTIK
jgi:hypothetical protein